MLPASLLNFIAKNFDEFSLKARLRPALLALLAPFTALYVWFPGLHETGSALAGTAAFCGLLFWLADTTRRLGRHAEKRLHVKWGGRHTSLWLRHCDNNLDSGTKRACHEFFSAKIADWSAPTSAEEAADMDDAIDRYETAVRWLLVQTRDKKKYPRVFDENLSYSFRRNGYAVRWYASTAAICAGLLCTASLFVGNGEWQALSPQQIGALTISLLAAVAWPLSFSEAAVRDAADAYAREILAHCRLPSKSKAGKMPTMPNPPLAPSPSTSTVLDPQ